MPSALLPIAPGVDLELEAAFVPLCTAGGLSLAQGQLLADGVTLDPTPTGGGLALLRVHAPLLATRFQSEWGALDANGARLVPRAVVQYVPGADSVSHFVLFTERPHYAAPAHNPHGNRCALHCALMGLGVTDAWQRHSPYAGPARPERRKPISRYDDYPASKSSVSREQFGDALKAHTDEDAYCFVVCDVVQFERGV